MKYIRKSFSLFWLIAVMLFGTVSASAASTKPETPVLSGTAAGNRVTLNWNKVKKGTQKLPEVPWYVRLPKIT